MARLSIPIKVQDDDRSKMPVTVDVEVQVAEDRMSKNKSLRIPEHVNLALHEAMQRMDK